MKREKDNEISFLGRVTIRLRAVTSKVRSKNPTRSLFERERRLASYDGPESSEESKLKGPKMGAVRFAP